MQKRLAVIIPYYQHRPGLLTRAVTSVFNQRNVTYPCIFVIDDGSPLPAEADLAALDPAHRSYVNLIRQPNGGAGSARNAGLNTIQDDIDYVAFLDPDDIWVDDHIDQACAAFDLGFDFFFADCRRHDESEGYFSRQGLNPRDHTSIAPDRDLYAVQGDFFGQLLHASPIGTSTVVFRNSRLGHVRFCARIRPAGEDLLFWMESAQATSRIAFSARIQMILDEGVNLSVAPDWASTKSMSVTKGYHDFYHEVLLRLALTPEQLAFVRRRMRTLRRDFAVAALGMLRRGRCPDARLVFDFLRTAPQAIVAGKASRTSHLVQH